MASILQSQGRKGVALSVLRRARAALDELGIEPPPTLLELERQLTAGAGQPRLKLVSSAHDGLQ